MVASKAFDTYIKKNIFTIYLAVMSIVIFYYLYVETEEKSLFKIDQYLKEYEDRRGVLQKHIKKTKKLFGEMKTKIEVVSRFENYFYCDMNIQAKTINFLQLDIPQRNFDLSRNLYIIYDPIIEISKTTYYSFDHSIELNNNSANIIFMKDNYINTDRFKIAKVCYFIIGFKK
jgi:hypothetical protein